MKRVHAILDELQMPLLVALLFVCGYGYHTNMLYFLPAFLLVMCIGYLWQQVRGPIVGERHEGMGTRRLSAVTNLSTDQPVYIAGRSGIERASGWFAARLNNELAFVVEGECGDSLM